MNIDLNLATTEAGCVLCRHCDTQVGETLSDPSTHALKRERPSTEAGPGVHADPALFVDRSIVLRQLFCPGCLTLLSTEIAPGDEQSYRTWSLA